MDVAVSDCKEARQRSSHASLKRGEKHSDFPFAATCMAVVQDFKSCGRCVTCESSGQTSIPGQSVTNLISCSNSNWSIIGYMGGRRRG